MPHHLSSANGRRRLLLWGAGGHLKVVLDLIPAGQYPEQVILVDDDPGARGSALRPDEFTNIYAPSEFDFVITIGDNHHRAECFARALALGAKPVTLIHPVAWISTSAQIGAGTVIMARAVVNAGARIGSNSIVNTAAVVEHDCVAGDHVHISPGSVLGGAVTVGRFAHIGLNASVLPGVSIGERAVVGAGAVVLRTVPAGATAVGVPAHLLRSDAASGATAGAARAD